MALSIINSSQIRRILNGSSSTSSTSGTVGATTSPTNRGSDDSVTLSQSARLATVTSGVRSALESLGLPFGNGRRSARPAPAPASAGDAARSETRVTRNSLGTQVRQLADLSLGLNPLTMPLAVAGRAANLVGVETGAITPDRSSRLGAFRATGGNERGTTGRAAHNAIGGIYMAFGTFGEDRIGDVFNSGQARQLFGQSVSNGSSRQLAEVEHSYWDRQRREVGSAGGFMGSAFSPAIRDSIQNFLSGV